MTPYGMFGDKTWGDVQTAVTKRVRRKWLAVTREEVDDSVADAMLAFVERWVGFPSTRAVIAEGNPEKCFQYAVTYGFHWAAKALGAGVNASHTVLHIVNDEDSARESYGAIAVDQLPVSDLSDEEQEDAMLARLLSGDGVQRLQERVEALSAKH